MDKLFWILAIVVALAGGLYGGYVFGGKRMKKEIEDKIGRTEDAMKKLVDEATNKAEAVKKEKVLEAKEEILRQKTETEKELRDRRAETQRTERRLLQREEMLDKKMDNLEVREDSLNKTSRELEQRAQEVEALRVKQQSELERIAQMTAEEARQIIMNNVQREAYRDAAVMVREIESKAKDGADKKARNIISLAIQKCAADYVAETTVSVVNLPNDEMKGRIIGREGRNIRSIETLTGCDLIIDDTPEAITVSSFDPVRREIARLALEKLIQDGRIHPARIEEMVAKAQKEVNATIKAEGERAVFETNIHGLHPELIKLLGRMKYRTSYGQNVLNHSIEVSHIAGLLASELGVDVATAKRAGLLHDIGKAIDHEVEGSHVSIGVNIARKYKEPEEVIHAIEAHHGDVEAHTVVACLVQAADAISAARPGARRENIENYVKRLEKLEEVTKSFPGIANCFAIQAGREIRIMVKPEEVSEDQMVLLARDIAKKIEDELTYPGQIKVNLLRETKAVDYAK